MVPAISKGTGSQSGPLQSAVAELLEQQSGKESDTPLILLDLKHLDFIDSNFLGALVKCLKLTLKEGGELGLCNLQPPVKSMFELTRLYNIFKIYENEAEGLRNLKQL